MTAPAPADVRLVDPGADLAVFTVDAAREVMGATAATALLLAYPVPARRALRSSTAPAGVLARLWLGAVVGAGDGDLSLGQVIAALASLLDEPVGELTSRLLGPVRRLVADGPLWR